MSESPATRVIYAAKHPTCGHFRAVSIVQDERRPKDRNDAMQFLADALNDGLVFERSTDIEAVRAMLMDCSTCARRASGEEGAGG